MRTVKCYAWILVTVLASVRFVSAQNYVCTETAGKKCLTVNPKNFWIVGEVRTFAFGGDAASAIVSELHANGWLECEGQSLDLTDFAELAGAIGTTWGSRDPRQSFLVPDLRGIFLRGWNHSGSQKNPDGTIRSPQYPDPGDGRVPPRTRQDVGQGGVQGNSRDAVGSEQPSEVGPHSHGYVRNKTTYHLANDDHTAQNIWGDEKDVQTDAMNTLETRPNNAYVMYFIYVGPHDLRNLDPKTGKIGSK